MLASIITAGGIPGQKICPAMDRYSAVPFPSRLQSSRRFRSSEPAAVRSAFLSSLRRRRPGRGRVGTRTARAPHAYCSGTARSTARSDARASSAQRQGYAPSVTERFVTDAPRRTPEMPPRRDGAVMRPGTDMVICSDGEGFQSGFDVLSQEIDSCRRMSDSVISKDCFSKSELIF